MATDALETTFRREWPRILAAVIRFTGSLELAEDSVQEAFARAAASRERELLINPAAWVTTVAKRIAVDTVRRDARLRQRLPLLAVDDAPAPLGDSPAGDDRLGLLFATCTPELPPESRLALALRFVCGVPTEEIADAMLVTHTAMSARLTRAKRQIEREGIRFSPADDQELLHRLDDVLSTIHLLFTIGHTVLVGEELAATSITVTAIELARALRVLAPQHLETAGVLSLLLLTDARSGTRVDDSGALVTLEHADRRTWNQREIREGLDLAAVALPGGGRFALEAGISGLHSQALDWSSTDWMSICRLYDRLIERWPSPAAAMARVIARSFAYGPAVALDELDALEPTLGGAASRNAIAARADLLRRMGRVSDARAAYVRARSFERNGPVRDYFGRRIDELENRAPLNTEARLEDDRH
ncbi:MAG: polymerase sigma-70 factor, subfamily [Actinomycetota bacterium]|nr:polymerase sigma-70 factor, subfamily [Actinomycetota bacterium]